MPRKPHVLPLLSLLARLTLPRVLPPLLSHYRTIPPCCPRACRGSIGDVFDVNERGFPMALFSGILFIGAFPSTWPLLWTHLTSYIVCSALLGSASRRVHHARRWLAVDVVRTLLPFLAKTSLLTFWHCRPGGCSLSSVASSGRSPRSLWSRRAFLPPSLLNLASHPSAAHLTRAAPTDTLPHCSSGVHKSCARRRATSPS